MNKIVTFSNNGIIDPIMWKTFGVSVKEKQEAIGEFGTGLKYAIAVLMREGRSMKIVSGGKEYNFGLRSKKIRGKEFDTITCNNRALPFTTHLGSKWELWQAYRELYSNCTDEGGSFGTDGETVIYAELGDIDHNDVFLDKSLDAIAKDSLCTVYNKPSEWIYRKGIRAGKLRVKSMFTYDLQIADLTEDRTIRHNYEIDQGISNAFAELKSLRFMRMFLFESKGSYEEDVSFIYCHKKIPEQVVDLVSKYRKDDVYMQEDIKSAAISQLGMLIYEKQEMDERQLKIVDKASRFCESIGHKIRYPVYLSFDLGNCTLATADRDNECIYLSDTVLDQGVKQVAATLIEENLHIFKGLDDCNYQMQTYLFDQIVTMGEKLTGVIL